MGAPVRLERARRAEEGAPLQIVYRSPDVVHRREQQEVFHVENSRRLVGALHVAAHAAEVPRLAVLHCLVLRTFNQVARTPDMLEERVGIRERPAAGVLFAKEQVEAVHFLPHLRGNDLAHRTGVLPRPGQAGDDGVGILPVERQELDHVLPRGCAETGSKAALVSGDLDHRVPLLLGQVRQMVPQLVVHPDDAGHVLGALDVAAHPVDGFRDAAQHESTQVSLLPPPCEELTTSEPFFSATRVRPPGST